MRSELRNRLAHPAWRTAVGTGLGYGVILLVLFLGLFILPYLLFSTL